AVWHQHLNLGLVAFSEGDHVIDTADGDPYIVTVSDCPDVRAARFGSYESPPPGIDPQQVYRFGAGPTDAGVAQLTAEAEQVAPAECRMPAPAVGNPELLVNLRPLVPPGGRGQREELGIEGHHKRFRQVCKLGVSDWGSQEHVQPSQQIKRATYRDQVDGTNSFSVEMKFRRLQTTEAAHWDKAKDAESKGAGGKMSREDQAAFSGLSRATSTVVVAPDLIEYVRADVEKEATLHKSLRLAREVMGLLLLKTSAVNGDVVHVISFLCRTRRIARSLIGTWAVGYFVDCDSGWVRALLQLRVAGGAYAVEQSSLGSYDPALLSLPDVSAAPVPLADVRGEGGLSNVELFVQQGLLSPSEAAARLRQSSVPVPYSDPKLRDQNCWSSFVQLLYGRHLIEYALEDGIRADIFFVKKKGGRLRMVADCRRSNEIFVEPDGVRLAAGDAFGCLEMLDDDSELTIEGADLKDAF
ncbi:unnamed protein product, partial [Prorocentrum cordatum]